MAEVILILLAGVMLANAVAMHRSPAQVEPRSRLRVSNKRKRHPIVRSPALPSSLWEMPGFTNVTKKASAHD